MKNLKLTFLITLVTLFLGNTKVKSQESAPYGKNTVSFNLTRYAFSEINIGLERFITYRKSIEINGGLIYVNNYLEDFTKDWKNSQAFSEHGYAGRIQYKAFRITDDPKKKWRDYVSPGLSYRYLYYNEQWFEREKTDKKNIKYNERVYQKRNRAKYGIEFSWGKVYEMNRTFAFEFYFGGGVNANTVVRTVLKIQPDDRETDVIYNVNNEITNFYVRPYPLFGIKFRTRF